MSCSRPMLKVRDLSIEPLYSTICIDLSRKQSVVGSNPTRVALFSFYVKKKLLGLVAKRFFHAYTQLGVGCLWWFNYPGPLLHVELEFTCLSGLVINISLCIGYTICLYIAYIRPQPLGCLGSSVVRAPV